MIQEYFEVRAPTIDAMHAEPAAALAAVKLASRALQPTHGATMGFLAERRAMTLPAAIARDPCENCGLAPANASHLPTPP